MASRTQIVLVDASPGTERRLESRLRELEERWSRFVPDSDISRLNGSTGQWVRVSGDTIRLIESMELAVAATEGAFDPTFLHQLLSAGYTTSIDDPTLVTVEVDVRRPGGSLAEVDVDPATHRVRVPAGLALDPGGIGKGLAADMVVLEALADGTRGALVSIGGDIAAAGVPPTEGGWIVQVEDPLRPPDILATFATSGGGVATSSTRSRRWNHDGRERHHVVDPTTGSSSETDLAAATVVAHSGWVAEAHATATLLSGSDSAMTYLASRNLSGLVVGMDGRVTATADLDGVIRGGRT